MNSKEIMCKNSTELTERQQEFVMTHQQILNAGAMITTSVISLAKNLKKMKDDKLYKEIECDSFEAYAEEICGLKRSQAYSYIQVLEKLGEEFVQSTGQIGITKLTLLASIPEEEKEKIIETVDIENTTVTELKNEIARLKNEIQEKDSRITEIDMNEIEVSNLQTEIAKLNSKIRELQNKPPEIQVQEDTKSKEKVKKLQEELKKKTEEYENALQQAKTSAEQTAELRKQINLNSDKSIVEFKIKFENLQATIRDIQILIDKVPEEKREGCRQALKQVVEVLC